MGRIKITIAMHRMMVLHFASENPFSPNSTPCLRIHPIVKFLLPAGHAGILPANGSAAKQSLSHHIQYAITSRGNKHSPASLHAHCISLRLYTSQWSCNVIPRTTSVAHI